MPLRPASTSSPVAQRLGLLAVISVVGGLLLAGMLLPVVGGVGLIARTGANDFENLPDELRIEALPQVSRILAADGSTLATFYFQDRQTVSLQQVPQVMQKALIAVEDVRFYEHHGIDVKGALRALLRNGSSGSVQQGGSTLTQQYVKNVLIEQAQAAGDQKAVAEAHADTLARKAKEAKYALELERRYTKAQILEGYLNIAYFGDGAYGVGTAARHYFDKPVSRLTLPQAALLAGLVQSPEAYDPAVHPALAKERRDTVLAQMRKYGFITQQQFDRATAAPIRLHLHRQGNGCEASSAPYFCDYVQHVIERSKAFGRTRADRLRLLTRGGLTIQTTLEPNVQRAATRALRHYVHPRDPSGVAGAEAVVEPGTGKVLALAVNRPYGQDAKRGENTIDYAVDHADGGSQYGFQLGSTFKVFVLAAALKEGIPVSTTINSPQTMKNLDGFTDCAGNDHVYPSVSNAGDSEAGQFNLITGTWFSVNTFYAQLEKRTGLCEPVRIAHAMGMRRASGGPLSQYPSFVLGAADGYSVLDLADAYATLAGHGLHCAPMAITKVTDASGRSIDVPRSQCDQAVPAGLADTITSILHGVLTKPGATAVGVGEPDHRPAAAKTGTAENNSASNFAGYTPQMAAAVWVGDPRNPNRSLNGTTIGGTYYREVFGASIAGPIWRDTLAAALQGKPVLPLPPPDPEYLRGVTTPLPYVIGLSVADAERELTKAGFHPVVGSTVSSALPAGTVAATSPSGAAPPGGTVVLEISNGQPPAPPPTRSASPQPSASPKASKSASPAPSPAPKPKPTCSKPGHGKHC